MLSCYAPPSSSAPSESGVMPTDTNAVVATVIQLKRELRPPLCRNRPPPETAQLPPLTTPPRWLHAVSAPPVLDCRSEIASGSLDVAQIDLCNRM